VIVACFAVFAAGDALVGGIRVLNPDARPLAGHLIYRRRNKKPAAGAAAAGFVCAAQPRARNAQVG
jgi:hypothetical protein